MGFFSKIGLPVLVSVAVHALVVLALAAGWTASPERRILATPKYIEAKLVALETKTNKKASAKKQPKIIDLTAKRKEQERIKREAEIKRQDAILREKNAKKKADAEKKRVEQELQDKKRQEQVDKQAAEKKRLQQEFDMALEEEEGLLQEDLYATQAQSYTSKFKQRIESSWSRPPSARTGMTCSLTIQLVPTGRIVSVELAQSSGNSAFDRSAMQAVKKVEIFPEVKDMSPDVFERYYRRFTFKFNPQDLRL
ncbi:MAG: colicin import membrane protein [Lentisphaeria bacterium]|jgi:colicin import membrane protein